MARPRAATAPKGGRPKLPTTRAAGVRVRVTAEELATLHAGAAKAGVSISDYVRAAALKRPRKPSRSDMAVLATDPTLDPKTYLQLTGIARNINQMTRHCNTHNLPPPAEMREVLAEIRALLMKARPANGA